MLRLDNNQMDLWESILPKDVLELNEELSTIDKLLEDQRFFTPIIKKFSKKMGRPTVPVSTYLRMMYLKFRYQLGYETLVAEVKDSIKWRKFCHLTLTDSVPDSTTLMKLTKKYGSETVDEINRLLIEKLKEQKVIRGKKLRIDTTVVEADIHYPTDASLVGDGIKLITRAVKKIKSLGYATRVRFRDRTRTVKKTLLAIVKRLRTKTNDKFEAIKRHTKDLAKILREVHDGAQRVKLSLWGHSKVSSCEPSALIKRLGKNLTRLLRTSTRILSQTERVLSGSSHIPHRLVSFFDAGARPIQQGKLSQPTQFGRKVILEEAENGIVTGYRVYQGNPHDSTLLKKAIRTQIELFGRAPPETATDRGFWSHANERWLRNKGVEKISIPIRGRKSKARKEYERQFWFRRLQRFRAGVEARISLLKRKFGLRRSKLRGTEGTNIWVGWCVMAHNLWQTARIS